ncbi:hypothetical protein ACIRL3_16445 [Streptomyces sp. NPDC102384]|uniref:hypothetical protein n=1 Tax=Streptomyces sp. NPDC102384 TaxID=3366166 RepID=UPI0038153206
MDELRSAEAEAEHPVLGQHRRTYRPPRRGPLTYVLLLLRLIPFSALTFLVTILIGAFFSWDDATVAQVLGVLALLGPVAIRGLWHWRHARAELRLYERGVMAVASNGRDAVYPWSSTMLFTDGRRRYKLANPDGTVITLGAADRGPLLNATRIRGLPTRTLIKGLQLADENEWGPAIQQAIGDAVLAPTTAAVLDGAEVPFGVMVVSRDGLAVRRGRGRGRDDFTTWQDVVSITVTDEGGLEVSSRGPDFPTHYAIPQYQVPHLEAFLAIAHRQRTDRPPSAPAPTAAPRPTPTATDGDTEEPSDVADQLSWYVTFGLGAWAAWRLGDRQGVDGVGPVLMTILAAAFGGFFGALFGLGLAAFVGILPRTVGEFVVEPLIRWFRHRRYVAALVLTLVALVAPVALLFTLFWSFPSRLVPLLVLVFFGGWALVLAIKRCDRSERTVVRRLPDLPGVALVFLAAQQLVAGDILTVLPAAGLFFPIAIWLCRRGWCRLKDSPRPTVQAAADVVVSLQLGLVLAVFVVWLGNVLSFSPIQVAAVRGVLSSIQGLTEVPWLYWLVAYTVLACSSYAVLRWPERVARLRERLRPARFRESRLPLGAAVNFGRRVLSGLSLGLMVVLLFAVVLAPVSEGTWKRPVAKRYALETQRRQDAAGATAAYREIHQQVTAHPRTAARLRSVVLAVYRAAPSPPGEPVSREARQVARQVGRYQAASLDVDDPAAPQPAVPPETDGLDEELAQLDESQRLAVDREQRTDRFAELASLAATRTFDIPDLGDNGVVQILKEYLGGLVEDGPVKRIFYRWGERTDRPAPPPPPDDERPTPPPPPDGERLVRIDLRRLTSAAYDRARDAVERADGQLLVFYQRFGVGFPTEEPTMTRVVDLANQHRYLRDSTGDCSGCVRPGDGGGDGGTTGGGGRR